MRRAAIQLKSEMEQAFGGIQIPSTLAFDYPNIRREPGISNFHGTSYLRFRVTRTGRCPTGSSSRLNLQDEKLQ